MNDPHRILGLASDATTAEVKAAYRRLARQWHPDLHQQAPRAAKRFREINEAYRELSRNPRMRTYVQPVPDDTPFWQPGSAGSAPAGSASRHPASGTGWHFTEPGRTRQEAWSPDRKQPDEQASTIFDEIADDIMKDLDEISEYLSEVLTPDRERR